MYTYISGVPKRRKKNAAYSMVVRTTLKKALWEHSNVGRGWIVYRTDRNERSVENNRSRPSVDSVWWHIYISFIQIGGFNVKAKTYYLMKLYWIGKRLVLAAGKRAVFSSFFSLLNFVYWQTRFLNERRNQRMPFHNFRLSNTPIALHENDWDRLGCHWKAI